MSRNLVTRFASVAGSKVALIVVSLLSTPLIANGLGQSDYGRYATVMATFSLLMILVSSGINGGVRKYIAEEREQERWQEGVLGYYFRVATALALGGAALLAVGAATGVFDALFSEGPGLSGYFYLLAGLVVAAQYREFARRALMGLKLEHLGEPLRVLFRMLFAVLAVALIYLTPLSVAAPILAFVGSSLVVFAVALRYLAREVDLDAVLGPLPADLPRREMLGFNHLTVVYIFLLTSMYHVDVLLLGGSAAVSAAAVGAYKAALALVQFLWVVPRSVQSLMIQSTSDLWAKGRTDRIQELASRATRYSLLVTVLLALGLGALASEFVPIYYYEFDAEAVVTPLLVLLPGTLGFAVARPILSINHAKGDMRTLIAATGAAAGVNLGLNLLLIPLYGTAGAALATTLGYGSLPVFQALGARRMGYDPFADARLLRVGGAGLLAGGVIFGLPALVHGAVGGTLLGVSAARAVSLAVVPPAGLLAFGAAATLTGAVTVAELFDLLGDLPDPVGSAALSLRRRVAGEDS